MAFNGRHLIVGFSADIGVEEHPISLQPGIYGNFDVCRRAVSPSSIRPEVRGCSG